ncbi:MAG: rRNA pseudouridine synthase [Lentisphaerae bacterium]|nr:rRNA pseudouridine synthase [Lentisphaerota bacterium]
MQIRLQKLLAERGFGSRRGCEKFIIAGRVLVNGAPAVLGTTVDPDCDRVLVDGCGLPPRAASRALIFNKPRGLVCTRSAGPAPNVYQVLPPFAGGLDIAGRLDRDSEGLLLLANDGGLLQRLTHPRHGHRKTYRVTVSGRVTPAVLDQLRQPLDADGYLTRPAQVRLLKSGAVQGRIILEFELGEGRNRQVRRLCERSGLKVHRLVRTAIGSLSLRGLPPGKWRELSRSEIDRLVNYEI